MWADVKLKHALEQQAKTINEQCEKAKQITEDLNNEWQKKASNNARRLAEYKRVQQSKCIVPLTNVAVAPASGGGYAGQNGISTDWLRDFAKECNDYREQRIILDKYNESTKDYVKSIGN
jgi:hypothetical protein